MIDYSRCDKCRKTNYKTEYEAASAADYYGHSEFSLYGLTYYWCKKAKAYHLTRIKKQSR